MRVLVIGSGGREAAIAWACRQHAHQVSIVAELPETPSCDLVIVGPEAALASGVADRCAQLGVPCFGPTAGLAKLETSKGFTRDLADTLGLPGPEHLLTHDADTALAWWRERQRPVVVKQDGLAAGKGVVVPDDDDQTEAAIVELCERGPIVVEERMYGPEVSLLTLCDGRIAVPLPLAQDHKRIGEGDTGPNTGGMGAYAPAPVPYSAAELCATFVQPVIDYWAERGAPYVGVLYAGLMLTSDGPRLVEFNCRFGDPEAQVVLPLLKTDLAQLALAACEGRLADITVELHSGHACTVVAAAPGYPVAPELGAAIHGDLGHSDDTTLVFPAAVAHGTDNGEPSATVNGGRVLAVTGMGATLGEARDAAYARMSTISFEGMQVRGDIGWRAIGATLTSYAQSGVDIDEGTRAVEQMRAAVEATHGPAVLRGVGSFGGSFSAAALKTMHEPVLVASTDGVGTKVELAARLGRFRGVGADIVNHCINDVLVQGAVPLFFLDYIASSKLDADQVAEVVTGMADACAAAGCALLGGETAEMPGVYAPGAFDIAGTLVGAVDRADLLPRTTLEVDDVLIGVASNGPHTNGYSFLRTLFRWLPMHVTPPGFGATLGDTLLEPHRNYLPVLGKALAERHVKALVHVTGGGLAENTPRVLPDHLDAEIQLGSWPLSPLWQLVREAATGFSTDELYRTVNMGVGMVVVCSPQHAHAVQAAIDEPTWRIGSLTPGARRVRLIESVTRRDSDTHPTSPTVPSPMGRVVR